MSDSVKGLPQGGERQLGLGEIQAEIRNWANQFGNNVSKDDTSISYNCPLGAIPPLLGMMEEIGELARAVARRHQGRGFSDPVEHRDAKEDALADCLVFMCDYANREDIDLLSVLNRVWATVQRRKAKTWVADKAKEKAPLTYSCDEGKPVETEGGEM